MTSTGKAWFRKHRDHAFFLEEEKLRGEPSLLMRCSIDGTKVRWNIIEVEEHAA